jgi:hypothetical protein
LIGAPKCALLPLSEKANSSVTVFPTKRAPAESNCSTTGADRDRVPDMARTTGLPPLVG